MEIPLQHEEADKKETGHRKKSRVPAVASAVKGIDGGRERRWLEVSGLDRVDWEGVSEG